MSDPDHKIKSISALVRSLIVVTLLLIVATLVAVYYMSKSRFVREEPQMFSCGVKDPIDYTVSVNKKGKILFITKCSMCHDLKGDPAGLSGVLDRIPGGDWKYHFIRNSDSMREIEDPYTMEVSKYYQNHCMNYPELTNQQIDDILEYVNGN